MQMIKRTLSIVLTVVMLVSMFSMVTFASAAWDGTVAIAFDGGSGTEADPYIIVNAEQLALMNENIKVGTDAGAYYKLGADITLNEGVLDADYNLNSGSFTGWTSGGEFTGVFDGDGHTIYGFYSTQQNGGLFSTVKGTIKNLKMKDAAYKSTWTVFGILASKVSTATIENVEVDGAIIGNQTGNTNSSRGIMVGRGSANFIGCIVRGKVVSTNVATAQRCGGFIGVADSTTNFTNCVNYADLGDLSQVGGFVGLSTGAVNFTDCINYGDITSSTAYASWLGTSAEEHSSAAGGFIGVVYKGHPNFTRCANEGTIAGDSYAGGLIGVALNYYHNITLNNIYNIGAISVMGTNGLEYADDFIGKLYNGAANMTSVEAGDLAAYQAGAWLGEEADLWVIKAGKNPILKLVATDDGDEPEAPHEHTEKTTTVDATCTADGSITVTCETCGETISTEVIAAKGHTEKTTTVDSTCTADGKTTVKCDVCGTVISETVIPATGHTYVDGKCECGDVDAATVAQVGDKYFYSFADAYAAAEAGDTITVIQTAVIDEDMTIANVNIVAGSKADPAIRIVNGATVTFEDVNIDAAEYCVTLGASDFSSAGNLVIKSGTYHGNITAISVTKGNLVIEGGNFSADPYNGNYAYLINCIDSSYKNGTATVTISGGNFENWNPQDNAAEGAGSDFCADGFEAVENEDGTFGVIVHEHAYTAETTDPTCTKAGKIVYTCRCDDTYEEEIAALGHNYVDGTCSNCGEADPSVPALPELKVKTIAMVLQSSISLQYKVEKSLFGKDGYADPYMTFVICGRESVVTEYTVSGDYYVFTLKQIAPNELTQTITATLYATANGKEYTAVKDYTAATYCYKVLEAYAAYPTQAKLLTLIVDLLNYGTQAQIYSNRYTDNLANAALTDAQKAFGTSETPTLTNTFNCKYETVENPTVTWKTKGLTLEDAVVMRFVFTTESIDGVTVKIKAAGKEFIMTEDDIKYDASANTYTVLFSSLDASMMSEPVYVTVYKDGVAASNTMLDTIESYAQQNQGVAKLGDLVIAMMKYGNAAKAYVGK